MIHSCYDLFIFHGREDKLDFTKVCHRIPQNQWEIILQIKLNTRAQTRALRKEDQMLQLKDTLHNL
jgi:hypothetical protein